MRWSSQELDLNKDGTLCFDEMQKMMRRLAPDMSEIQLQTLFCAADVNLGESEASGSMQHNVADFARRAFFLPTCGTRLVKLRNQNGVLELDEFIDFVLHGKALRPVF